MKTESLIFSVSNIVERRRENPINSSTDHHAASKWGRDQYPERIGYR